jgi:hypothetical protein
LRVESGPLKPAKLACIWIRDVPFGTSAIGWPRYPPAESMRNIRDDEPTHLPRIRRIQSMAEELAHLGGEARRMVIEKLLQETHALHERIMQERDTKRRQSSS